MLRTDSMDEFGLHAQQEFSHRHETCVHAQTFYDALRWTPRVRGDGMRATYYIRIIELSSAFRL